MSESWRCFVALPIDEDLRDALRTAAERWAARPDLAGLRWADPDAWHVTLAFIGAVDSSAIPHLDAALQEAVERREVSTHSTGGVGGFPSTARARVAWYGVGDPSGALAQLAADVRRAVGLPDEGPYRPHVTLARARAGQVDLRGWVGTAGEPAATLAADRVELMRSHLGRGPARYEPLASIPLRSAAHV